MQVTTRVMRVGQGVGGGVLVFDRVGRSARGSACRPFGRIPTRCWERLVALWGDAAATGAVGHLSEHVPVCVYVRAPKRLGSVYCDGG